MPEYLAASVATAAVGALHLTQAQAQAARLVPPAAPLVLPAALAAQAAREAPHSAARAVPVALPNLLMRAQAVVAVVVAAKA